MTCSRKHIQVVCALLWNDKRVLVAKRPPGKHMEGLWEFPGGKIEEGETAVSAIVREMAEETGCTVEPRKELPSFTYSYELFDVTLIPVVCIVSHGTPEAIEHSELIWADRDLLSQLEWVLADVAIAEWLTKDDELWLRMQ